ncbi:methyltransferase domain-containing protein [Clostridium guangxiense]|uniref:methyltransferase domain-containing protein n=1 Tax=Clostridium guangxiense TaxID=1662055 RepID=UPI001E5B951C|nr:class I SAM-dependent methyltransferase [Clostridium guangxiense]MCD2346328.1 class I SAM-dependent methyltransferase [Clostridium guangxiense]
MFKEHDFTIWGTYCKCGNECSILENEHHPWLDTGFTIKLKCGFCGNEVIIDRKCAEEFYNNKIYSYYNDLYGKIVDLGCGGAFLSRYLLKQDKVDKIYGLDCDEDCINELTDIKSQKKFEFIQSNISNISSIFSSNSIDFLVSRDVFMFVEDTDRYFDDITRIVTKGIRQMGWYIKDNSRMRNKLEPKQITDEYIKRGWKVELKYLDWYKCGYFIRADRCNK